MLTLAFESSARPASVALMEDDVLVSQYTQCSALTHSRTLLPMAEDLLKNAEISIKDIDRLAVAQGPGSFTGIRIGISTVKGLAWALDKPCVGVSTLEAMAWNGCAQNDPVCCVMDARRSQVYNALFRLRDGKVERLTPDRALSIEELLAETIICRIARKVCQRNSVVGKAEISYDISSGFVLQHITGSKADAIIQWGVREYEVIQVFVPTVKSRNYIICAKTPKLEHIPVHHFKTSS